MSSDTVVDPRWRRNTGFFLAGQTVSLFGSSIVQYAVMWYVTLETGSGLAVGLYALAAFAPQGVISLFGGVVADRMNRKVLVMIADSAIAAATLVLALLMLNGVTDLWIIVLAVAVRSVGAGFQQPAVQAMIPQIVPEQQLMRINGVFGSIQSAMALLAPAAAVAVFAAWGIVPVFFIDVVTAVIGVGLLALVPVRTLAEIAERDTGYFTDLADGFRYIRAHAFVRWVLALFAVIFLLTVAPSFLTPLMAVRSFGGAEFELFLIELAFSIGMLLGGVLVATLLAKRSRVWMIVVSCIGFGAFTAGLGLSPTLWLFYAFMFLIGLFVPIFSAATMTLLQQTVPADRQGRVFSYVGVIMALATPLGAVAFGPLADVVGVELLLVISGLLTVVVIAVALLLPSGRAALRAAGQDDAVTADAEVVPASTGGRSADGGSRDGVASEAAAAGARTDRSE